MLIILILFGNPDRQHGEYFRFASAPPAAAQTLPGVYTHRYDNSRSGVNPNETILNPSLVNQTTFGLLFTDSVDGQVYGQPLYVPALNIGGQTHNVMYAATENDSVFAFDADNQGPALSQTSLLGAGEQPLTISDVSCREVAPQIGITSTPVIDPVAGTLYVVARSKLVSSSGTQYFTRLHALSITNLTVEQPGFPVTISGSVPGTGQGSSGGIVSFNPQLGGQRAALLLAQNSGNGKQIYVAFASSCDHGLYHGWIFEYDAASGQQLAVFSTTPNGSDGGIWQTGNGLSEDAFGEIYAGVGNGDYNPPVGDYGDSLLQLTPPVGGPGQLTVADSFTPSYQCALTDNDLDFGMGGVVLLPPQLTTPTNVGVTEDKAGTIYLNNLDDLGGGPTPVTCAMSEPSPTAPPPECAVFSGLPECFSDLQPNPPLLFSAPIFFNGNLYVTPYKAPPEEFTMNGGTFSTTATATVLANQFGNSVRGPGMSLSASGTSGAILWIYDDLHYNEPNAGQSGQAILFAYDPNNLSSALYTSNGIPTRDNPGLTVKFAVPTAINGKVYIGTQTNVAVYGLLPAAQSNPIVLHAAQPVNVDNATSVTLPLPAAADAGDLLIAYIGASALNGGSVTITPPHGWTRVSSQGSNDVQYIYRKIVGSAEPPTYTFTASTAISAAGGIADYTTPNPATPIDIGHNIFYSDPVNTISIPSLTTGHPEEKLLLFVSVFPSGNAVSLTGAPGTTEELLTQDANLNVDAFMADQPLGVAGPVGTRTVLLQTAAPAAVSIVSIRSAGN